MAGNKSMFWRLIFQALRLRLQRVFIILIVELDLIALF